MVSGIISEILDKQEYLQNEYFLEVSSPGIERVLRKDRHIEASIGKDVEIKFFKTIDGKKSIVGKLLKFDADKIYIQVQNDENGIERSQIAQIKIKYNWE